MTPLNVLRLCAAQFDTTLEALYARNRVEPLPLARQLAAYVLTRKLQLGLSEAGRVLRRDHSTVAHGAQRIAALIEAGDERVCMLLASVLTQLDQEPKSGVHFVVPVCALHPEEPASPDCEGWRVQLCDRCLCACGYPNSEPSFGGMFAIASELMRQDAAQHPDEAAA